MLYVMWLKVDICLACLRVVIVSHFVLHNIYVILFDLIGRIYGVFIFPCTCISYIANVLRVVNHQCSEQIGHPMGNFNF